MLSMKLSPLDQISRKRPTSCGLSSWPHHEGESAERSSTTSTKEEPAVNKATKSTDLSRKCCKDLFFCLNSLMMPLISSIFPKYAHRKPQRICNLFHPVNYSGNFFRIVSEVRRALIISWPSSTPQMCEFKQTTPFPPTTSIS